MAQEAIFSNRIVDFFSQRHMIMISIVLMIPLNYSEPFVLRFRMFSVYQKILRQTLNTITKESALLKIMNKKYI